MKTQAEHIPNELWILIFSYLEAHDLFNAFTNLNRRFNRLLSSTYLRFYVEIKNHTYRKDHYKANIRLLKKISKRVICLQMTVRSICDNLLRDLLIEIDKLIQLQSLTILIKKHESHLIELLLEELPSIKYLSITCEKSSRLIKTILNLSTLRILKLIYKKSLWYGFNSVPVNNNIRSFYINFQGQTDYPLANLLLSKMPNIKQFEISGRRYDDYNPKKLFIRPISNLSKLQTVKFLGGGEHFFSIDINSLAIIIPSLQHLYIDIYCHVIGKVLFDHLVSHWWPLLEKLTNIYINIQGCITEDFPTQLCEYWNILLDKNRQSNNCFKIEWKSFLETWSLINLLIVKEKKKELI